MTLLFFAEFTDEVTGLVAVGSVLVGFLRWVVNRERATRLALQKEREDHLVFRERAWAAIKSLESRTSVNEGCIHTLEKR